MRVIAFIQARMEGKYLPGKVMKSLAGKPILWHVVNRLQQVRLLHEVVVVTSFAERDATIVRFCERHGIKVFTGAEQDVLDRFYHAAQYYQAQAILRIKGDCPFVDATLCDRLLHEFNAYSWDSAALNTPALNAYPGQAKFPAGLEAEAIRFACLQQAWRSCQNPIERTDVSQYIWQQSNQFNVGVLSPGRDYSHIRLKVSSPQDYALAKMIYQNLNIPGQVFKYNDVLAFLNRHKELLKINGKFNIAKDTAESAPGKICALPGESLSCN